MDERKQISFPTAEPETSRQPLLHEVNRELTEPVPSVCVALQQARMRAGLELTDVADTLRIRLVHLEALEEGRFDDLPGQTYAVGFLRSYAAFLGLDTEETVRRFKEEMAPDAAQTKLTFPTPTREGRRPKPWLIIIVLLLAGASYGGWQYYTTQGQIATDLIADVSTKLSEATGFGEENVTERAAEAMTAVFPTGSRTDEGLAVDRPAEGPLVMVASGANEAVETALPEDNALATTPATTLDAADAFDPLALDDPDMAIAATADTAAVVADKPVEPMVTETAAVEPIEAAPAALDAERASTELRSPASTHGAARAKARTAPASARVAVNKTATAAAEPSAPSGGTDAAEFARGSALGESAVTGSLWNASSSSRATIAEPLSATETQPEIQAVTETAAVSEAPPNTAGEFGSTAASAAEPEPESAPRSTDDLELTVASASTTPLPEYVPQIFGRNNRDARVVITATADAWVQVQGPSNELLLTRILRVGDSYRVPNRLGLALVTGNAGALSVTVDGRQVAPVGPVGVVLRDVSLDPDKLIAGTAVSR